MAAITEQQLGQIRPPTADAAVSLYSPGAAITGIIQSLTVCNTSGDAITYRIFVDDDGTTYDETTAVFFDVALGAGESHLLSVKWPMNNASGNIACSSSSNNAVTFTAFGLEIT